jgi:rRNA maturation protein Nop10
MDVKCPRCGEGTVMAAPAKYSPDDKYARYRSPLAYGVATPQDQ